MTKQNKAILCIFDLDSTVFLDEAYTYLAKNILQLNQNQVNQVEYITNEAMSNPNSNYADSIDARLSVLKPTRNDIIQLSKLLCKKINPTFKKFLTQKKVADNLVIKFVTGGMSDFALESIQLLGFSEADLFANTLVYDNEDIAISLDKTNLLSTNDGKIHVVRSIVQNFKQDTGYNFSKVMIAGDGMTDLKVFLAGQASHFGHFVGVVDRDSVSNTIDNLSHDLFENVVIFDNFLDQRFNHWLE